ncbi:MAG: prepilin-type N-terminal cleavage/methylation domain-containing protein [Candidatus Omnitrophota bacterium]|nr:prepilin-type N-terminal cleavage/methylation domain-containing protein [Candidatus Omnitrophota bacterium]|tara:strand:+ start:120 stop:656 length:537 start_codon:yes stop_codon:yes gene_type:complete
MKPRNNSKFAFTLIEVTIAIALFSIIIAAIFSVLAVAKNSWKSGTSQLTVQQDARKGLRSMTNELRQCGVSTISGVPADGSNYTSITFNIPDSISVSGITWSTNVQYSLGGLNGTQLLRTQDSSQTVLANNISALTFSRTASDPATVNISITAQKNTFPGLTAIQTNLALTGQVKVRN